MSVVVIGMEEPERCPCELAGGYEIADPCFAGAGSPYMHKEFYQCVDDGTRPDWCPIRPLPEKHGRLLDADAFEAFVQEKWAQNEISNGDWMSFREWLRDQETIIEAEGGSDE